MDEKDEIWKSQSAPKYIFSKNPERDRHFDELSKSCHFLIDCQRFKNLQVRNSYKITGEIV